MSLTVITTPREAPQETGLEVVRPGALAPGSIDSHHPDLEYLVRLQGWLRHLGVSRPMGFEEEQIKQMRGDIFELPTALLQLVTRHGIGQRIYGQSHGDGTVVVQPGYAAVLAHEIVHRRGKVPVIDEAMAVAAGVFAFGSEREILDIIYGNRRVYGEQAQNVALVNEAMHMDGRYLFVLLEQLKGKKDLTYPQLLKGLDQYLRSREQAFQTSNQEPRNYLVDSHRVSPKVAGAIIDTTGLSKGDIYRNNCEAFKDMVGAFKALVSFYHIQLKFSLKEAIEKVEKLFDNGTAVAMARTLHSGAQEAFSLLGEYQADPTVHMGLAQAMIENGPEWAVKAKEEIPKMIKVLGYFGPKGDQMIRRILKDPILLSKMIFGEVFWGLLGLREHRPDLVMPIVEGLCTMHWSDGIPNRARDVVSDTYNFFTLYGHLVPGLSGEHLSKLLVIRMYNKIENVSADNIGFPRYCSEEELIRTLRSKIRANDTAWLQQFMSYYGVQRDEEGKADLSLVPLPQFDVFASRTHTEITPLDGIGSPDFSAQDAQKPYAQQAVDAAKQASFQFVAPHRVVRSNPGQVSSLTSSGGGNLQLTVTAKMAPPSSSSTFWDDPIGWIQRFFNS